MIKHTEFLKIPKNKYKQLFRKKMGEKEQAFDKRNING